MPLADQSAAPHLPTAHLSKGIQAGSDFWADYGESLGEKFNEWLLK
jgi:putative spermidine/putrescine transport system substrate-binding protein